MSKGLPFDAMADFIKKLDKAAADGSSTGYLDFWGDFTDDGEGKWGVTGAVALSETLAKLLELAPIELRADVARMRDWVRDHSMRLHWEFGLRKPGPPA